MMDRLIRFSLTNRALVLVAAVILLFFGGYTALRMPVDVFPDLTAPTVTVITEAHGMAPLEVESQVTLPIESAVNGAPGVRRVRSSTSVGVSIVWVEFDWGTAPHRARQIIGEKLQSIVGTLPGDVEQPVLSPETSIMGEVMFLALTSERHTPTEMHTVADTVLRRRLLAVPGVAKITPTGGGERQYQVVLHPERLQAQGVSLSEVAEALKSSNANISAGFLDERGSEYLVTGMGRFGSTEDIARTVVSVRGGVTTLVGDLGEVRLGEAPRRGEACANGQPAVLIGLSKQPGANTLALTAELDRVLDEIAGKLPEGMRLDRHVFRQADFITVAVDNVKTALLEGVILVVLVVLLFLGNVRATLITVLAIPLSLVAAVLTLHCFGATINTMTLGGMAIAIGALVDDAVIDVENVFRRLREELRRAPAARRPVWQVVYAASVEIRGSIVFATLIIALVFVPLLFLSGVEGRLMRPLGVAYLVALLASLIVAVTVTPALCYLLLPRSRAVREGREPRVVEWLKRQYARVLEPVLEHPLPVTVVGLAMLAAALGSLPFMGRSFLPEFNEGALTLSTTTLPGTSLAESSQLAHLVDEALLKFPEVVSVGRRTGRSELDEHSLGVEASEIEVTLRLEGRDKARFLAALRQELSLIPGLTIIVGQPISHRIDHMLSGTRASIAAKIFGPDLHQLRQLGEQVRQAMSTVPGVVDLSTEPQVDVPTLRVQFDRAAMAPWGLRIREVGEVLQAAVRGLTVGSILEGHNSVELAIRLADPPLPEAGALPVPWRTDTLGDLLIDTPGGHKVPLRAVARVIKETGPNTISREQVERKIVVSANVAERDVISVVRDCRARVEAILEAAPGYRIEFGGQFQSATEAGRLLLWLGMGVVVGIGLLLHLAFGSARDAALVMLNLPLALIGGVLGVFVSGGVLSVASLIGFITVFGIATRNGIMLVSHIRHLQEHEGVTVFREAIVRGAIERLAPILMTALAAGLALIPLALGGAKPGSEIETPMAIVILFGLLSSMVLNMVVVPTLYLRYGRPVGLRE
ncbi:MAG: CusA/CzcA family heavy metal efflux RND transporter [Verrucomicrobia bacterium]|nr:CusA/CzcA family heavy metal efflux RND transporter [Verrucomicrobiota bacterium]